MSLNRVEENKTLFNKVELVEHVVKGKGIINDYSWNRSGERERNENAENGWRR